LRPDRRSRQTQHQQEKQKTGFSHRTNTSVISDCIYYIIKSGMLPYRLPGDNKKRSVIHRSSLPGDKSGCTGGVYRARTYDLHDVKAPSRWSGVLEIPLVRDDKSIIVCRFKRVKSKGILKRLRVLFFLFHHIDCDGSGLTNTILIPQQYH